MNTSPVLTDALIERMLVEQAGSGAPADLAEAIAGTVAVTRQRGRLRVPWQAPTVFGSRRIGLAAAFLLLAAAAAAAAVGAALLNQRPAPPLLRAGPLIVYQVNDRTATILTIDPATGARTTIGSVQLTAELGGQRIRWTSDHTQAFVFDDPDRVQAVVDVQTRTVTAIDAGLPNGGSDEVSPAGDRIARVDGTPDTGQALSIVTLTGHEEARIALPRGVQVEDRVQWSPDGSTILLSGCSPCALKDPGSSSQVGELLVLPVNGDPVRTYATTAGALLEGATWSPDGTRIAFARSCAAPCGGITVVRISDGVVSPVTTIASDGAPAWSPDGARLAFVRDGADGGIWVANLDGSQATRLTTSPSAADAGATDRDPIWSPDGAWVAFTRGVSDTSLGDVWIAPTSGTGDAARIATNAVADWGPIGPIAAAVPIPGPTSAAVEPTPATDSSAPASRSPHVGPTSLVLWQLDGTSGTDARTESVYLVDVASGDRQQIGTLDVNEDTCCPETVQWSTDRQRVALVSIFTRASIDLGTGRTTIVSRPPGQFKDAVSHDGLRVARADEVTGASTSIVISDLGGREQQRSAIPAGGVVMALTWSPDDASVAAVGCLPCNSGGSDQQRVWIVPVDGGAAREAARSGASPVAVPANAVM